VALPAPLIGRCGSHLDSAPKRSYHQGLSLSDSTQQGRATPNTTVSNGERDFGMSTFIASADHAATGARWHLIDADGQVLGRIATKAARILQGKHKASYTPFIDTGDHVVVVNAVKVKLTGRKEDQKIYRQHSGYEGGLRETRARIVRQRHPERLVEDAIRGMLPKTKIGEAMYRKLKVYAGPDHPHTAQKPMKLEVA